MNLWFLHFFYSCTPNISSYFLCVFHSYPIHVLPMIPLFFIMCLKQALPAFSIPLFFHSSLPPFLWLMWFLCFLFLHSKEDLNWFFGFAGETHLGFPTSRWQFLLALFTTTESRTSPMKQQGFVYALCCLLPLHSSYIGTLALVISCCCDSTSVIFWCFCFINTFLVGHVGVSNAKVVLTQPPPSPSKVFSSSMALDGDLWSLNLGSWIYGSKWCQPFISREVVVPDGFGSWVLPHDHVLTPRVLYSRLFWH